MGVKEFKFFNYYVFRAGCCLFKIQADKVPSMKSELWLATIVIISRVKKRKLINKNVIIRPINSPKALLIIV